MREPQAWVLKIARNECLARIEARMRRPLTASLDDGAVGEVSAPAPSVPRTVELRSDLKAANDALGRLPTAQREAYVLREWLGLSTAEVALSIGTTVTAADALLGRARRELVRVLGTSHEEGAAGCHRTREALAGDSVDRAARAHLVRCRSCRSVRSALRPQLVAARSLVPPAALAARLGDTMPGFAAAGTSSAIAGSAAGGGGLAALAAKLASGPAAVKGAAAVATMLAVGGGVAIEQQAVTQPPRAQAATATTKPVKLGPAAAAAEPAAAKAGDDTRGTGTVAAVTSRAGGKAGAAGAGAVVTHRARHRSAPAATTPARHRSGHRSSGSSATGAGEERHRHRSGSGEGDRSASRGGDRRDGDHSGTGSDGTTSGKDGEVSGRAERDGEGDGLHRAGGGDGGSAGDD